MIRSRVPLKLAKLGVRAGNEDDAERQRGSAYSFAILCMHHKTEQRIDCYNQRGHYSIQSAPLRILNQRLIPVIGVYSLESLAAKLVELSVLGKQEIIIFEDPKDERFN